MTGGTVADRLAAGRRRRFVGRAAEVELVRHALAEPDPPFAVLHVHGPGGIGKSSLLEALAEVAAEAGAVPVRLDGRDLPPSTTAVLEALGTAVDVARDDGAVVAPHRIVLLIDTYERLAALDDWLRTALLPRLPAAALTVLASRQPPAPAWRADPGWRDLLRVVTLRNWSPEESRRYLRASEVDPALHDRLVEASHGHPLGLSLLADVVARGGEPAVDPLAPDLVGILLQRFVDVVPTPWHREALQVCALARATTEPLLRDAVGNPEVHELFAWLRGLPFVESGPDGLAPHDLARDCLDADLRWRDPDGYRRVFRAVRGHVRRSIDASGGREQLRAMYDEKFLFRSLPGILSPVDWDTWGRHYPQPARGADHAAILDLVRDAEGRASAAIARRWLDRQPEAFWVLRREDDGVRGVLALLDLTDASPDDLAADPGARAAREHARRHAPPRPGEVLTQTRFVVDADAYQGPSPTLNAAPILTMQRYRTTPRLSWDYLALAEPDRWNEYFAVADLPRADGADFVVDGRRYGLFAHDFRRVPFEAWLDLVTERALARDVTPPRTGERNPLVLSHAEFSDAVRQALRDLHRPDLLARNPLQRTRLLREHDGALERLLRDAVDALAEHPRDDRLLRAVDRTYLRPAATQERAAAVLGLPFSTYRRHLAQGVARVVDRLWDREVYGRA